MQTPDLTQHSNAAKPLATPLSEPTLEQELQRLQRATESAKKMNPMRQKILRAEKSLEKGLQRLLPLMASAKRGGPVPKRGDANRVYRLIDPVDDYYNSDAAEIVCRHVAAVVETLCELAENGNQTAIRQAWDCAVKVTATIQHVADTSPKRLQSSARGSITMPALWANRNSFNPKLRERAKKIELGLDCAINTEASGKFSLETPINKLLIPIVEKFHKVIQHIEGCRGPGNKHGVHGFLLRGQIVPKRETPFFDKAFQLHHDWPLQKASNCTKWAELITDYIYDQYPEPEKLEAFTGVNRRGKKDNRKKLRSLIADDISQALDIILTPKYQPKIPPSLQGKNAPRQPFPVLDPAIRIIGAFC